MTKSAKPHLMIAAVADEDVAKFGEAPRAGLWCDEGLYYVELTHPAAEEPICVALHGVRTVEDAEEAMCALAGPTAITESWL